MPEKRFVVLLVAALLAVGAAYWAANVRAPQTETEVSEALVPGLREAVNSVAKVTASGAGGVALVTLEKGDAAWTVAQKGGYPADASKIRKFLLELADAALVERKTAKAENYAKLGVEDVTADDAPGLKVELSGIDAEPFVIGNKARGTSAVYVRRGDDPVAWVANKPLAFARTALNWLNKDLIDIDAKRIARVTIRHPDGKSVDARRDAANFVLTDMPARKALTSPTAVNPIANVLDALRFDDVQAAAEFDAGESTAVEVSYVTVEGIVVDAKVYAVEEKYYASFASRVDAEAIVIETPEPAATDAGDVEDGDAQAGPAAESLQPTVDLSAARASAIAAAENASQKINRRVAGWVYKIPQYKYEQMTHSVDDFVKDEE